MKKLTDKLQGTVLRIPLNEEGYCYARILEDSTIAFYDYQSSFPDDDLAIIIEKTILFVGRANTAVIDEGKWEIIGNVPLDSRHKIMPVFFDPQVTNIKIADYTIEKIKETLKYKTYEDGGLQYGGIHAAEHFRERLIQYFKGEEYSAIKAQIEMVEHLRQHFKS